MRILWIQSELLHPLDKGGRIRTYHTLRALAREHHVTFMALDDGRATSDALQLATEYAHVVECVPLSSPEKGTAGYFLALAANLLSSLPYAVARYESPAFKERIAERAREADLVVCDFLTPAVNVPTEVKAKALLFQHNVEAMIWKRHAEVPQNALRRLYMTLQWRRMARLEARECQTFARVVAVSAADADKMRSDYGLTSISHVETGVDVDYFTRRSPRSPASKELVFVGSMDWMPNEDGALWFVDEVLGRIKQRLPEVRLTLVGRRPTARVQRLAMHDPCIEVTGDVPDVRPFLERAALSVVPLRIGGGTRLKIYEAMAMQLPVVSTTIGAEGLPLIDGEHLAIADTPDAQAEAILELLTDPERRHAMAAAGHAFVRAHCGWDMVAQQFLHRCAGNDHHAAAPRSR